MHIKNVSLKIIADKNGVSKSKCHASFEAWKFTGQIKLKTDHTPKRHMQYVSRLWGKKV